MFKNYMYIPEVLLIVKLSYCFPFPNDLLLRDWKHAFESKSLGASKPSNDKRLLSILFSILNGNILVLLIIIIEVARGVWV